MDKQTKSGVNQLEQTTIAEGLTNELEQETEISVQAKENNKLDNSQVNGKQE